MASVTGRLYLVTAYLDERQGPMWEATHSRGLKLRELNRISQLSESDCSYVFHVMMFLITWHMVSIKWSRALRSIWFHHDGQLMVSCSETSQQIYVYVINVLECLQRPTLIWLKYHLRQHLLFCVECHEPSDWAMGSHLFWWWRPHLQWKVELDQAMGKNQMTPRMLILCILRNTV